MSYPFLLCGANNNGFPAVESAICPHLPGKVPQAEGRVPGSRQSKLSIGGDDHITHKVRVAPQGALGGAIVSLITGQLPHDDGLVWKMNTNFTWAWCLCFFYLKCTHTMTAGHTSNRKTWQIDTQSHRLCGWHTIISTWVLSAFEHTRLLYNQRVYHRLGRIHVSQS